MSNPGGFKCGYIAVIGRPNAGKSSLINSILGQKVNIVSAKPQTTRRLQLGIYTTEREQFVFCDTPGRIRPRNELGRHMLRAADESLEEADVVLWVVDVSRKVSAQDKEIGRKLRERAGEDGKPVVVAMNKSDRLAHGDVLSRTDRIRSLLPSAQWMLVSAKRGDNLDMMLNQISAVLPAREEYFSDEEITQTSMRQLAADIVRESVLYYLQKEVPHGVGVEVEQYKEESDKLASIAVTIIVEKKRHKGIVIGKHGSMLKLIGARARREIAAMRGGKVYLESYVKVEEGWRNDIQQVTSMA